jgi:precorrin-2 dehydrogenase/sirohydrochlorin ferrochelatase
LFLDLRGKSCLVVGGGKVAERKIKALLECGAEVRLVARDLTNWLHRQCEAGLMRMAGHEYDEAQLANTVLVFAATSDPALNRRVAADAQVRGLWCNMATDPELGSFTVPSVVRRGPLTLAMGTSGLSPAMAKRIREKLESQFGAEWAVALEFLGRLRETLQAKGLGTELNQYIFKQIAELPLPEWIIAQEKDTILAIVEGICQPHLTRREVEQIVDEIWTPSSW